MASSSAMADGSASSARSVTAGMPSASWSSAASRCSTSRTGTVGVAWPVAGRRRWPPGPSRCIGRASRCGCSSGHPDRFGRGAVSVVSGGAISRRGLTVSGIGLWMWSMKARASDLALVVEPGRQHDPDARVQVALAVCPESRQSLAGEPECPTVLGARRQAQQEPVARTRVSTGTLAAQQRLTQGHRQLPGQVRPIAREDLMPSDRHHEGGVGTCRRSAVRGNRMRCPSATPAGIRTSSFRGPIWTTRCVPEATSSRVTSVRASGLGTGAGRPGCPGPSP